MEETHEQERADEQAAADEEIAANEEAATNAQTTITQLEQELTERQTEQANLISENSELVAQES